MIIIGHDKKYETFWPFLGHWYMVLLYYQYIGHFSFKSYDILPHLQKMIKSKHCKGLKSRQFVSVLWL